MASILPFLKPGDGSFDDYATRVMGEAFDDARKKLHSAGQPHIVFETIAARIIAAASKGERDPVRLRNAGLAGLSAIRPPQAGSGKTLFHPTGVNPWNECATLPLRQITHRAGANGQAGRGIP